MPETGLSPMRALSDLMPALTALGPGGALLPGYRLVTLTHARMGEAAFGVAPGAATLLATLSSLRDEDMISLCNEAELLVKKVTLAENLTVNFSYHDIFHACTNASGPVKVLQRACDIAGIPLLPDPGPMRWSEDFGLFAQIAQSAMFLLGAGEDHPQLHNPDYDFPDDLIPIGVRIFEQVVHDMLG